MAKVYSKRIYGSLEARFWPKVCKNGPILKSMETECWIWTGSRLTEGYGNLKGEAGIALRSHRASWELTFGKIESGLKVLHKCDNPSCVRPDHLFLGTDADNANDRDRKGRCRAGKGTAKGDADNQTKVSDADVIEIRAKYATGNYSQIRLAGEYNLSQPQISRLVRHKRRV